MSRLNYFRLLIASYTKIILVIIVGGAILIFSVLFFADKLWYADYQPTLGRLSGQWYCSGVQYSIDWNTLSSGGCLGEYHTYETRPSVLFTDSGGVALYSGITQVSSGRYFLLPRSERFEEIMEFDLDKPFQAVDGFYLREGKYIIEMSNINEFSIRMEDGSPKYYRIFFKRQNPKFDITVVW